MFLTRERHEFVFPFLSLSLSLAHSISLSRSFARSHICNQFQEMIDSKNKSRGWEMEKITSVRNKTNNQFKNYTKPFCFMKSLCVCVLLLLFSCNLLLSSDHTLLMNKCRFSVENKQCYIYAHIIWICQKKKNDFFCSLPLVGWWWCCCCYCFVRFNK